MMMMNRCDYYHQQNNNNNNSNSNALVGVCSAAGAGAGTVAGGEMMMNGVVCPKPRRLGVLNPSLNVPTISRSSPRCQPQYPFNQAEMCESKAGMEVLDMILSKGCYGTERTNNMVPSSPPFFSGSPPSRASNPLIQDAHFGNKEPIPFCPSFEASPSSSSSARKNGGGGSCSRGKFGQKPATVRIEGFNCRGISAVA